MANPLTITDIESKMSEIQIKLTELKESVIMSPKNISPELTQFKSDINDILQSIDVVSGSEYKGGKIYIRLLFRDIIDPIKQSSYFTIDSATNTVTSTPLLKAEIDVLKKLVNDNQILKDKINESLIDFQPPIDTNVQTNIKTAINNIDSTINL